MSNTQRALIALLAALAALFVIPADAAGKKSTSSATAKTAPAKHKAKAAPARKGGSTQRTTRSSTRSRASTAAPVVVIPFARPQSVAKNAAAVAREFDRWLDGVEASNAVPGLAATVVKDDRVLLERGIGYADASTREAVSGDTVFRLASLSKGFAAALSGILIERGLLHWDTRIADVLPTFTLNDAVGAERLTVADILSHRVGLPHNTFDNLLEQEQPYELLVDQLKDVPLTCPVGQCYGYQNIAFSLIGDVTYASTGDFYGHQVVKWIFQPLGMETATYGRDALESSTSWARPHRRNGNGWLPYTPNENYYRVTPAAGLNASIRDMSQWLIAQMGGRPAVLSPQLLKTLHTPLVRTDRDLRSSPWRRGRLNEAQYALGWRVYNYAGTTLVFHAGAVQGYRAMIAFLPEYRFGAVMMWNNESAMPIGLMPMLLDRYLGLPEENWAGLEHDAAFDRAGDAD